MLDTRTVDRTADDVTRLQWRGSCDGIMWSTWSPLSSVDDLVDAHDADGRPYLFCQGRILRDGRWHTSPVAYWPD